MNDMVLLDVLCGGCELSHDVYGVELPNGRYSIDPNDLRCPCCDCVTVASVKPRESLA